MVKKKFKVLAAIAIAMMFLVGCSYPDDSNDSNGNNSSGSSDGSSSPSGGTSGGGGINPTITIKNSTGYYINYMHMKPSTSTDWGSYNYIYLSDGESKTITLSQSLSANSVYDIRLESSYSFRKYKVTISNGMTITFTTSDFDDGSNLPDVTIQNRTGKTFDAIYFKPSVSSDWGTSFGSISNNNDRTVTIPIPPSSYTAFDIQMKSSNPTNTYTRNNVTISNGMTLLFTSADADNSTIELPIIVIQNNTGYYINYMYIKPSSSTDWESYSYIYLSDGELKTTNLPQHLSTNNLYDIRLVGSGFNFTKYSFTVSEGIIVTFTTSDLEE